MQSRSSTIYRRYDYQSDLVPVPGSDKQLPSDSQAGLLCIGRSIGIAWTGAAFWQSASCNNYTYICNYIVWWLHNYGKLSIVRRSFICNMDGQVRNGIVLTTFGRQTQRFICCALTISCIIYSTLGWSISDLSSHIYLGAACLSIYGALVVYIGYGYLYTVLYILLMGIQ